MLSLGRVTTWALFVSAVTLQAQQAPPGVLNHTEGQVSLDDQAVTMEMAGLAVVDQGHTLRTAAGHAEVLLTPGVFLRMGDNSVVRMLVVSAGTVSLELVSGAALVEADQLAGARLDVRMHGADANLERAGLYLFQADDPALSVYSGRMRVTDDGRGTSIASGQQLLLNQPGLRPRKFDRTATGPLQAWSLQRADDSAQISEWTAESLLGMDDQATHPDGWYWSPWYKSWAFIPRKGRVLTPFGYGLYAPQTPHYMTPVFADFRE